jgi:hypothetical protein
MKDLATLCIAALLMTGFYALGSTSDHHSTKANQGKISSTAVIDTVPRRNDTLNKRMPKDTMSRKDTIYKKDSTR